jgi:hypothetical protein
MKRIKSSPTLTVIGFCLIVAVVATLGTITAFMQDTKPPAKPSSEAAPIAVEAREAEEHQGSEGKTATNEISAPPAPLGINVPKPFAPLTGTKNIPGDYATLALAITDLNTNGVGSGGVTFNLIASNPQTAPAGGYIIGGAGSLVLTTSSAANPIVFTGNSNTITAFNPQTVGNINDGIIKLIGADFVTIQGFTIQENPANTISATAASNNMTEFGVALFYVTTTDGAQNNTIQNNTITLNRTYLNTFGIYSNTRTTSTAVTGSAEATAASGSNSNNKVYGNAISNVNYGVVFIGAGTTIAAIDNGNDIGGTSAATGNTITNWGGGSALSSYTSLTGSNYCIFDNQQINDNVSFNTITSAALAQSVTTGGFLKNYSVASPTSGTITTTINNNTVTITNNTTGTTTGGIIGINNQGLTPLLSTATMSMNNNTVQNSVLGGTTATTAGISAITNLSLPGTMNMTGNSVINNAITATTSTSGLVNGLSNSGAAGTLNMNNNIVRGFASTATSGQIQGITNSSAVVTAININTNQFGNASGGFASSSVATSGSLFGISTSGGASTCALSITGNDIRGITYSVAASAAQTYIINSATTLSQNISTNTFTNLNANTTGNVTFISDSVSLTSSGTKNINSNSIVTGFNKGGAGGTVTFYSDAGLSSPTGAVSNANNNNFSNITVTGATTIAGWSNTDGNSSSDAPAKTFTGNTFSNITGGSSAVTIATFGFSGTTANISSNTISSVSGTGAITGISLSSSNNNMTVSQNTINTLSTTGAAAVVPISVAAATTGNIFRNKIYDIQANNAGGTVNGILVSAGTSVSVYNNLIGDLRTPSANTTNPLIGINVTGGTTVNAYYNTVYLNATSSGSPFGSSAISASTTPTLTLRNNVFVNTSTPAGAGLSVAYRRSSTTLTSYASASNNNDFFASTIFNDGTNTDATIAAYKTRVASRDSASFSENPPFLSTTGSSANFLHISAVVATQLESGGTAVTGITDDFDGQTRNVSTPDVGGDEFAGIATDLTGPVISYTNLGSGASGVTTRAFSNVTITDASGVNTTSGTKPRVYYKKSTDTNDLAATGWKFVEANGTTSPFDFTINYAALNAGSVSINDTIQYFVVAQDLATTPNVSINSGTFNSSPSSVALTGTAFPITGTINNYNIVAAINGTKTVCASGCNYTSLTGASGVFNAINTGIATGDINIEIAGDLTTNETGAIALNQLSVEPTGSNFNVKIYPTTSIRTISGSASAALIKLNGADRVTIDGSIGGTGTDRSLTITNTNSASGTSTVWFASLGTGLGATNDTIKNTNILTGSNSNSTIGIQVSGGFTTSGADNDSITIQNNTVNKALYGIYLNGNDPTSTGGDDNPVISNNVIGPAASGANNIGAYGIYMALALNATISGNTVQNVVTSQSATGGIYLNNNVNGATISQNTIQNISSTSSSSGALSISALFLGNAVTNATVSRNTIQGISSTTSSGWGVRAIIVNTSAAASAITIANNMISDVFNFQDAALIYATTGIDIDGSTGGVSLYSNSVNLFGSHAGYAPNTTGGISTALLLNTTGTGLDIRDNVFSNSYDNSTSTGDKAYAVYSVTPNTSFADINYNDYYVSGTGTPVLGFLGADQSTIAAWRTATGKDAQSLSANPQFASTTNLHITRTTPGTPSPVENVGTPIGAVTNDYDNDTRDASTPDIGADEVTTMQFSAATYSVAENVGGGLATITVTRTAGTGNAASVNYATSDGTATGGASCTGSTDYVNTSGTLNFAAGDTSKTFTIPICNDSVFEADETVNLTLSSATGSIIGTPNTAVLTITNDDDITFNSSGSLAAGTYNNITINNCGTFVDLTGNITVNGTLTINSCAHLLTGAFIVSGGGSLVLAADGWLHIGSPNGITSGTTLSGNIQLTGGRSYNTAGNYVYTGTTNQAVGNGLPGTVADLLISNTGSGGNNTVTGNSGQIVTVLLEVVAGVYSSASTYKDVQIDSGATLSLSGGVLVSGNWTNNGTVIHGNQTVTFNGSSNQTIGGSQPTIFKGLTISNAAGVTLAVNAQVDGVLALTNGDLNTTSSFTLLMGSGATSTGTGDVKGSVNRSDIGATTRSFGNPDVRITETAGTVSDITVKLVKGLTPNDFSNAVKRIYTITANNGTLVTATVRLRYIDSELNNNAEATLDLWRKDATLGWQDKMQTSRNDDMSGEQNWVELAGVTQFSDWVISGPTAPTDVAMMNFKATRYDKQVHLEWQTGYEVSNIGFNVYREKNGSLERITPEPVAGSALIAGPRIELKAGLAYSWWDEDIADCGLPNADCQNLRYWIEDLDLNGRTTIHGPFGVSDAAPGDQQSSPRDQQLLRKHNSSLLSALGRDASLAQTAEAATVPVEPTAKVAKLTKLTGARMTIQSGVASQPAAKLSIQREGWYRVEQAELIAAGIPSNADPVMLQLLVDGREVPMLVAGGTVAPGGKTTAWSGIEFYGIGIDSPSTANHVYWLVVGDHPGLRIGNSDSKGNAVAPSSFFYIVERRDKTVYFPALKNGGAEKWFGPLMFNAQAVDQSVTIRHLAPSTGASLLVSCQGFNNTAHTVRVLFNGVEVGTMHFSGLQKGANKFVIPATNIHEGTNQIQLIGPPGTSDLSLAEFVQLSYSHTDTADNNSLRMPAAGQQQMTIDGFTNSAIRVMDVTDSNAPVELRTVVSATSKTTSTYSATVNVPGSGAKLLMAFASDQQRSPAQIVANQPSSYRDPGQRADYIVITRKDLIGSFGPLADWRNKQNLLPMTIDIEDLYDEFSFGNKTPQALKDFLAYAKTTWARAPRFVVLGGDATYDPKNYSGLGDFDLVPTRLVETTYNEAATDDWFADVNGDSVPDIAIGRLPVRTPAEASAMVTKLINYDQSVASQNVVLVADRNSSFDFEAADTQLRSLIPAGLAVTDIRRGQVGDANARSQLLAALNQGSKLVNYYGHGSTTVWTDAPILSASDAAGLTNRDHLSLIVSMTCLSGSFQGPSIESLGESLLKSQGGAIAVWASSGLTDPTAQTVMSRDAVTRLFAGSNLTIGEVVALAKSSTTNLDVRRTWILLGDPATRLK